jgi:Peptidase family M28
MKKTFILVPLFLATLVVGLFLGFGVGVADAATVTRYQQTDLRLQYTGTWSTSSTSLASGGSFRYTNTRGSSVSATFNGTSFTWIAKKSPVYGMARVTLDDSKVFAVDLYSATTRYGQTVWSTGTLSPGYHTVTIQWTGAKNARATAANIGIDAVDVTGSLIAVTRVEQGDQRLGWTGRWMNASGSSYTGGSIRYANSSETAVTIDFTGVSLKLIGTKAAIYGKARVTLDDGSPVLVDLYSPTSLFGQRAWSSGFLPAGRHTVKFEWTGDKGVAATNTYVALDAVEVIGSLTPAPFSFLAFDSAQAMAHLRKLAVDIGVRHGGTAAETSAAQYAVNHFTALGYQAQLVDVPVINGRTSHNVFAVKRGSSPLTVVIGAHMDSYGPSPGGNDNGSGSAAVLELARALKDVDVVPTVVFVLFGQEEPLGDGNPDHHHYGSRRYVALMTAQQEADLVGMISLDMVGYGSAFHVRYMEKGPRTLVNMLMSFSSLSGAGAVYLRDPSRYGYSDHESFELAGYPAAWIQWRDDPVYHTANDTYAHCSAAKVQRAGGMVLGFLGSLRLSDLQALQSAKN